LSKDTILSTEALGFPWGTDDPFLFCVHHLDRYPKGNGHYGPDADLSGRDLGQDFANKDGWNMYHGVEVPGFPAHPHRGFETLTVMLQGRLDHADSLGAAARYGDGDAQWMTAGSGISHTEMFPLLKTDAPNPAELFQIWINLAPAQKMAKPNYKMLWAEQVPKVQKPGARVTVYAGSFDGQAAPTPPPDSWASQPGADLAVFVIDLDQGATLELPAGSSAVKRNLYCFEGEGLSVNGQALGLRQRAQLKPDVALTLKAGPKGHRLLFLQGRPIGAPVANYGPFVMNTRQELMQAFEDYQRTQFGGWPWPDEAPVHGPDPARFAKFPDGREERPR
jgi:redox-sensitive bicupin YhaK (pirin superfamily)